MGGERKHERVSTSRRDFLRLGLLGTIGAGVASVSGGTIEAEERSENVAGYRETEHIRAYYQLARL